MACFLVVGGSICTLKFLYGLQGLLQSEVEGADNENVGFYGRCALHARYAVDECTCDASNNKTGCVGEKEESCARTEVFFLFFLSLWVKVGVPQDSFDSH